MFLAGAFAAGVDPADNPLQVRELPHHLRDQIDLREPRRFERGRHLLRARDQRSDRLRKLLKPPGLLEIVSEAIFERETPEPREFRRERLARVGVEEEPGVGQARIDHPLGALSDRPAPIVAIVHDRQKSREQRAAGADRKVLLVVSHRRHQNLLRELQIGRIEPAGDHAGMLHEIRENGDEIRVVLDGASRLRGEGARSVEQTLGPLLAVGLHAPFPHLREIVVKRRHLDVVVGKEPVPAGRPPGGNAEDVHRDHGARKERHDSMNRADEEMLAGAPPHHFRKAHRAENGGNDLGQELRDDSARHRAARDEDLPFRRGLPNELPDGNPLSAGEPFGHWSRTAIRRERPLGGRPRDLDDPVRLARGQAADQGDEAPRRGENRHRFERQIRRREPVREPAVEIRNRVGNHAGRHFLQQELEKKLVRGHLRPTAKAGGTPSTRVRPDGPPPRRTRVRGRGG